MEWRRQARIPDVAVTPSPGKKVDALRKKTFKTELLAGPKEDAVEVPFDPASVWGSVPKQLWLGRRGHEVIGTVNGFRFESCIVPRQKKFFMLVDNDVRKAANVSAGDTVKVTVEPITK
jgi:hypothetical protein